MALIPFRIAADIWRNRFLIGQFIKREVLPRLVRVLEAELHTRRKPRTIVNQDSTLSVWLGTVATTGQQLNFCRPDPTADAASVMEVSRKNTKLLRFFALLARKLRAHFTYLLNCREQSLHNDKILFDKF
jgi:hypothetical protein